MKVENSLYNLYEDAYAYKWTDYGKKKTYKDYNCVLKAINLVNILKEKEVDLEYLCYTIRQQPFLNTSELLQLYNNRLIWGFYKRQLTLDEITLIVNWLRRKK